MAWCALALGLALTYFSWQSVADNTRRLAQSRFEARSAELHAAIQSRLIAYAQVLRGAQAYVGAIGHPGRSDWERLYRTLQASENYPGITGIVYIRSFTAPEAAATLDEIAAFEPGFALRPAGERPQYAAVTSVEPRTPGNLPVIGSDSWAHPERRRTLEAVRDSGENRITGKLNLVIDDPAKPQAAFLMYQAVYRDGAIPDTVPERQKQLLGYVTAGFRIDALMLGTLGTLPDDVAQRVYDGEPATDEKLFHASHPGRAFADARFRRSLTLAVGGRTWTLEYASLPAFEAEVAGRAQLLGLALGGGLVSLLLFVIVWSLATTHARAEAMAGRMTRSLRESETKLRALFAQAPLGVWLLDTDGRIVDCNDQFARYAGVDRERILGFNVLRDASDPALKGPIEQAIAGQTVACETPYTFTVSRVASVYQWHFQPVRIDDETGFVLGFVEDISARKIAETRIEHLAHHDALTGLANRTLLADRIGQAILAAGRGGKELALCFLDLDYFKRINDSVGHSVGDQVLIEIARRLRTCVRESDTLARIGGDEFVLLLGNLESSEDCLRVVDKAIAAVVEPIRLDSGTFSVTTSVGIAVWPHDGADGETLMRNADVAMYHAKNSGRNSFQFFSAELNAYSHELLALESDLREAVAQGQLVLHYQAQVDGLSGGIIGAEALVRWQHPVKGMVSPAEFIPLAEERGLIDAIGDWVLTTACRQMRAWDAAGLPAVPVAVNISPRQFRQRRLQEKVMAVLADTGVAADRLVLEITESAVMDDVDTAIAILHELKKQGVRTEIDDFGTGHSSLSYLKRLPIQRLKIDRSFVRDIPHDSDDIAIVTAILSMAANLSIDIIAEGVETATQEAFLLSEGCIAMQGFRFARPLPADDFALLLRRGTARPEDSPA